MKDSQGKESELRDERDRGSRVDEKLSDKYRLVQKIGEGGMGAVYEAQHTFVGRRFAIKFLHRELARNKGIIARFQREAQAAGALENENIAAVTDFGYADDGAPYIVMEYLEGGDFRQSLVREGRLPVTRLVNIVIQACRGLSAAHARGIIHRDIKPDNLFIAKRDDGTDLVKILDFGIAKLRHHSTSGIATQTGTFMGTLHYMPIEQIRGDKDIDHRADIYSLGAILYEGLTGTLPHPGVEPENVIFHLLNGEVVPVESLRPELPKGLPEVVYRALALEPHDRYQSVAEFAEALTPFAGKQIAPFNTRVALPVGAADSQTVQSPISEVRSVANASDSIAACEVQTSETQRAIEAAGVTSVGAYWRRIAILIGISIIGVLLIAALLVSVFGSSVTQTATKSENGPSSESSSPLSNTGEVEERVSGSPPITAEEFEKLQQQKREMADQSTHKRVKEIATQSIDKSQDVRPDAQSGRPVAPRTGHPSASESPGRKRSNIKLRKATNLSSQKSKKRKSSEKNGELGSPPQTEFTRDKAVIEHRKGSRKVEFDKINPYE